MIIVEYLYWLVMVLGLDFFYIGLVPSLLNIFPLISRGNFENVIFSKRISMARSNIPGFWIDNGVNKRCLYRKAVVCKNGIYLKNTSLNYILCVYFDDIIKYDLLLSKKDRYVKFILNNGDYLSIYPKRNNYEFWEKEMMKILRP